jgi:hypothetical protein
MHADEAGGARHQDFQAGTAALERSALVMPCRPAT